MENVFLISKYNSKEFIYEVYFIVLILFMNFYFVENNEELYKSIYIDYYQKLFVFSADYIYSYDSSTLSNIEVYNLHESSQKISSSIDAETISWAISINSQEEFCQIYIIAKTYLYNFSKDGTLTKNFEINIANTMVPSILTFNECINEGGNKICFLFYGFILQNNKIMISRIKHTLNTNIIIIEATENYEMINSEGVSSESMSNYISCQTMEISNKKILTCFYENNNYEIGTIHIYFENFMLSQYTEKSPQFKKNNGAIIIKSAIYSENTKAIVCYINNYNDCACLTFDIIANNWSDCEYKYLENCKKSNLLFYIDFYKLSNEYILSCFDSNNFLISVSFNSNMELIDTISENTYCISNYKFSECGDNSFSSALVYNDGYKMVIICSNNSDELVNSVFTKSCEKTFNLNCLDSESYSITTTFIDYESTILTIHSTINYDDIGKSDETEEISNVSKNNIIKKTTNQKKEDFVNNLDNLMKDIEIGKVYELQGDDYEVKISPINFSDFEESSTYIDFLECEKVLRDENHLPPDSILTVVQIEIYKYDEYSLTNQVEYAVYNEEGKRLELSVCENKKIDINYAITNTSVLDLEKILYFSDMNVDILNIKDPFFNDICFPYSDNNNNDMILKDRIIDIYQNYSICDDNCEYKNVNITSMLITCNCNVKKKIDTKKPEVKFKKMYKDLFREITFNVMKCYRLVFNWKNKLRNIGFIIFSLLVFLHIPIIIYYIITGIIPINKYIIKEMEKFKYLPKLNSQKKKKQNIYHVKENNTIKLKNANKIKRINIINSKNSNENSSSNLKSFHFLENRHRKKVNKKCHTQFSKGTGTKIIQPIFIFNYQKVKKNKIKLNKKEQSKLNTENKNKNTSNIGFKKLKDMKKNKIKIKNENDYHLIKVDAKNIINLTAYQSKYFLDNFEYEDAIIYDKRSFWRIYIICLYAKENFLNTFCLNSPLELKSINLIQFIFKNSCDLALNALFYFSEKISDKYNYRGHNIFWYNLLNNLSISVICSIVSYIIAIIFQLFTNSKDDIEDIFKKEERKLKANKTYVVNKKTKIKILENVFKINKNLEYKLLLFLIIEFSIILFFYYFVTAFCEVYKETQYSWGIDSFTSFLFSFPVEFFMALLISIVYKINIKKKYKCIYKIAMILYSFL